MDAAPFIRAQLAREQIVHGSELLVQSRFSAAEIAAGAERLVRAGGAIALGNLVADRKAWESFCVTATGLVDAHHRARPEEAGISVSALRSGLPAIMARPEIFDALLAHLGRTGFVHSEGRVRRSTHQPELPPALQGAGARLREVLARTRLDPPSRKELAPDAASQQALRFLIQRGEVVEVGPEIVLRADDFVAAREAIKRHLAQHSSGTVSQLRQVVGASRRIVVPLLEKLDRAGVTRRQGDLRVPGAPGAGG